MFGSHGYERAEITDVAVRAGVPAQTVTSLLGRVERMCEPCDSALAARKLAELRALTVHRAKDAVDVELLAAAYTQRLAQYPADVVAGACDWWADANQFWPSWAELKDQCDRRMKGRTQIRDALRKAVNPWMA